MVVVVAVAGVYWGRTRTAPPEAAPQASTAGKTAAEPAPAVTPPAAAPSAAGGDTAVAAVAPQEPAVAVKPQDDSAARREAEEKAKRAAAALKSKKEADAIQNAALEKQNAAQEKAKRDAADAMAAELAFWNKTKASTNPADYDEYLNRYPNGHFTALAKSSKESLTRNQQEAKELAAQRARLEEERRKAKEQETRNQAETQALEQERKAERKVDAPRKSGVFVAPTF
jgi:hypothetical protein